MNWTFGGTALQPTLASAWDSGTFTIDPWVIYNSHGFYEMAYTALDGGQDIGYAVSADGITWFRYQVAPILTHTTACTTPVSSTYVGNPVFFQDGINFYLLVTCDNAINAGVGLSFHMADN